MDFPISDTFENGMKWDRKLEKLSWCGDYTTCHRKYKRQSLFLACCLKMSNQYDIKGKEICQFVVVFSANSILNKYIFLAASVKQIQFVSSKKKYIPIQNMLWLLTTRECITTYYLALSLFFAKMESVWCKYF